MTDPKPTDRRERYAAALYATLEVTPTRHPWETLSPLRRAVWYARADAAMAVADAERAVVEPPADRAALRQHLADALYPTYGQQDRNRSLDIADAVLAGLPAPTDRAAVLRDAADAGEEIANRIHASGDDHRAGGAYDVVDKLRRMADETPAAKADETEEQRADREETERDHAAGDHTYCGITCETEMPTELLRNFVIAKGYPGTKGALAELERRAAAGARQDGAQDRG